MQFAYLSLLASALALSERGVLLLPTTAKRTDSGLTVQVKGRLSTGIIELTMIGIIRDTQRALAPDSDNELKNSVVRGAYLATSSIKNEDFQITGNFQSPTPLRIRTNNAGIFSTSFQVSGTGNTFEYQVRDGNRNIPLKNSIQVLSETGFSVISDVDDTIKFTDVNSRLDTLTNTFFKQTKVIDGMPQYYSELQKLPNVGFHYLSSSPFQILPMIQSFVEKSYPKGEITLSTLSSTNFAVLFNPLQYKLDELDRIVQFLPRRKYILIGDSTQADPEAYATTYRKFPSQVQCIFIRRVRIEDPAKDQEENGPERFKKAFEGIPEAKTFVFDQPTDLPSPAQIAAGSCRK
jgi:phosphatidate phosphatase APP1